MVKNKHKHFFVIVSCLLAVMIAITPLFAVNNNRTTANADGIVSSDYLIVMPSFTYKYNGLDVVYPTSYISFHSDNTFTYFYPSSIDGSTGHYNSVTLSISEHAQLIGGQYHAYRYDYELNKVVFFQLDQYNTYIKVSGDISLRDSCTYTYVIPYYNSEISGYGINYGFSLSPSDYRGFDVFVGNYSQNFIEDDATPVSFNYTTIASPVDKSQLDDYIIDSAYQRGYNDAYQIGYNKGLNTTWGDLSPFKAVVNGVDDFINAPIFGNVNLKTLFFVAFGVILFGLFIKVFFGG